MTHAELLAACAGGIVFTGTSVREIREDRKTSTTRLCKKAMDHGVPAVAVHPDGAGTGWIAWWGRGPFSAEMTARLYPGSYGFRSRYQVGKRYYVKEGWNSEVWAPGETTYSYRADAAPNNNERWRSAMVMPRAAARYVIEILTATPMRLKSVTPAQVMAEGIVDRFDGQQGIKQHLFDAWDAINGKRCPAACNPWVFSHTFRRVSA